MQCKEIKEYIFDYLLGELDSVTEMRVNEHLLECADCRKEVNTMETMFERIKDTEEFTPDKKVLERIIKRVETKPTPAPVAFFDKPVKLYYAVATLFIGIILASVPIIFMEKKQTNPTKVRIEAKKNYEITTADSITFYSVPSRRLGGT